MTIVATTNAPVVAEQISARLPIVLAAIQVKMDSLSIKLQSKIQASLSGPVLQHRTGKLENSIRIDPATIVGSTVVGGVEGAGGVAWYGILHEFGGTFDVREYTRRSAVDARGRRVALLTRTGLQRSGKSTQGWDISRGTVRAHTITFPERSFMRSNFDSMRSEIVAGLTQAVSESNQT